MESDITKIIGSNIKKFRESRDFNRNELADKVGVSSSGLANYENGNRAPSIEVLVKLATVLQVPIDILCGMKNIDPIVNLDLGLIEGFINKDTGEVFENMLDYIENKLPNDVNNDIREEGEIIKKVRTEKNITQKQLAELINENIRTVQRYESGDIEIPLGSLFKISKILNISILDLTCNKDKKEKISNAIKDLNSTIENTKQIALSDTYLCNLPQYKNLSPEQIELFYKSAIRDLRKSNISTKDFSHEAIKEIKDFIKFIEHKYPKDNDKNNKGDSDGE